MRVHLTTITVISLILGAPAAASNTPSPDRERLPAAVPAAAPVRLAQQTFDRPPTRGRGGGGGRAIGIGIGIGVIAPLVIDALRNQPQAEPADKPPPRRRAVRHPPANASPPPPPRYVSLPDPAPLPPDLPASPGTDADGATFRPGEVVALIAGAAPPGTAAELASDFNLFVGRETALGLTGQRVVTFYIPDDRPVGEVESALAADPRTDATQKNYVYTLGAGPVRGSMAAGQYALAALKLDDAHARARGRGIVVAVIDSQIAAGHPELAGAIAGSYDAAGRGLDEADAHGTSVAGIIGARGGLIGTAPEASILAVRAFWKETADGPVTSSSEAIARGIDWAVAEGAQVLNMSFVGPRDRLPAELIAAARRRGVIAVAAAGNAGPEAPPAYPAAYEGVIAVTATDAGNGLFGEANRGGYVDVAAPGVDILSPAPDGGYQTISGTSMASAHVSGILALFVEAGNGAPTPPAEAEADLAGTARDLGAPGRDPKYGAGLADAAALITARAGGKTAGAGE